VNRALGLGGISLGFGASLLGLLSVVVGIRRHQPKLIRQGALYAVLTLVGAVIAFAAMERALITRDFSLAYVQHVGSTKTPRLFNVASLWSSLEGSILLWVLILTGYVVAVVHHFRARLADPLVGWAMATLFVITGFFFLLTMGPASPFRTASTLAFEGQGPNPLLQDHVLMAFHPPILYLGFVGFSVPFAFAIAALITGRVGEGWLVETRRWTLFAWGFLTVGILLGAWWSYEVLGWGGYWAWDPVENASFLPWLTGTAFIHSVMVQERRGMLRVWNLSLLVATFSLTILGTFLTRSGVIDSVHAFTNGSIGPYLLTFFGIAVFASLGLIAWRGDRLRSPGAIDSPVSREGAFLANNVLFGVFALVVLVGTVFPLLVEAIQDRRISVGEPFFDRMTAPLGLSLLTLMAIAPVLPWRKASGELLSKRLFWPAWGGVGAVVAALLLGASGWMPLVAFGLGGFAAGSAVRQLVLATRRQGWRGLVGRANGGMIVHLGVIVVAVAFAASHSFSQRTEVALQPGQSATFAGHTFELLQITESSDARTESRHAQIRIDGGAVYAPALVRFNDQGQVVGTPSVKTSLRSDLYLSLEQLPTADTGAKILILVMPLTVWLWIGGGVMAFGTALAAFPGRRRRNPLDAVSAPVGDHDEIHDDDHVLAGSPGG
jgi:cytochrome c-type biogenesis protein CcmF